MSSGSRDEPFGGALLERGDRKSFSLISRGDRVRGVACGPGGPGQHPLVVLAPPDGRAEGAAAHAVLEAWSGWAWVAAVDLPLCGARSSDKLSLDALDGDPSLAGKLRGDLEAQLANDLMRTFEFLTDALPIDAQRAGLAAAGRGAELALGFLMSGPALAALALSHGDARVEEIVRALGEKRGLRLDGEPPEPAWLAAAGGFLERALARG